MTSGDQVEFKKGTRVGAMVVSIGIFLVFVGLATLYFEEKTENKEDPIMSAIDTIKRVVFNQQKDINNIKEQQLKDLEIMHEAIDGSMAIGVRMNSIDKQTDELVKTSKELDKKLNHSRDEIAKLKASHKDFPVPLPVVIMKSSPRSESEKKKALGKGIESVIQEQEKK